MLHNIAEHEQPIIALCTPQGSGAIGLLRLSGPNIYTIIESAVRLASAKKLQDQSTHTIHYGWVIDVNGQPIDQVLFLVMKAPKTFTGQDVLEITCHNNQFLIEAIIDRMLKCGVRIAGKGEFTQRAVMLGKIDLLQAEAINDLIHAQTSESLKYSLKQLDGSLSSWIGEIENAVLEIMAFCEGSFEFLDEEMEFASDIIIKLGRLVSRIEKLLQTFPKQKYIKEGIRIALIGSVNAGKSSLFNCLLEKNRAIVTPIPGTTRDTIEAGVFRSGEFITFVDTAGIRKTDDEIEQQGIDRSIQEAATADIILLVFDGSSFISQDILNIYQGIIEQHANKVIVVINKQDIAQTVSVPYERDAILISAKNNQNIDNLYQTILQKIEHLKGNQDISCLLNRRQYDLLSQFLQDLHSIEPMLKQKRVDYELLSYRLRQALQLLAQLTGRSVSQAALDKVFQSFCVGK